VSAERPLRFAPGIRLRRETNGAYLMIPEGVLELSPTAAAILDLLDGERTTDDIVGELEHLFDADPADLRADVAQLCATLRERGFLRE